jgi:Zn ribbon nucleic-acid-binding protein
LSEQLYGNKDKTIKKYLSSDWTNIVKENFSAKGTQPRKNNRILGGGTNQPEEAEKMNRMTKSFKKKFLKASFAEKILEMELPKINKHKYINSEEPTILNQAAMKIKKESIRKIQIWIDDFIEEVERVNSFYAKNLEELDKEFNNIVKQVSHRANSKIRATLFNFQKN